MPYLSAPDDLALHGVRVLGFTTAARVAGRFRLNPAEVRELLLDHEASGWVSTQSFAGDSGWSITDRGRAENERRMAAECDRAAARPVVTAAHQAFLPVNERFGQACTDWQIRPAPGEPMAFNDHADGRWDDRVLRALASAGAALTRLCGQLSASLARFGGYPGLYASALARAQAGQYSWVDAPGVDSCHLVWIQFHEDLLATLGIPRGEET